MVANTRSAGPSLTDILLSSAPVGQWATQAPHDSRREFWDILTDLYSSGTTIVVSTPYMDKADRCTRVGLLYAGRMVVCDTPQVIRQGVPGDVIEIQPDDWRSARAWATCRSASACTMI